MPPPTASLNPKAPHPKNGAADKAEDHVGGKPDQKKYNEEQDALNKEIAQLKTKVDAVRSRIALGQAPKSDDRRSQLKAEMDALRGEQGKFKTERNKLFDEMRKLQDALNKKIKDVNAQRQKTGFKNASEVGQRIKQLESQVESGTMTLVAEKKALQEISQLRRAQKTMENSSSSDEAIAADKARIEELKKKLDDPEAKKVSDRFDELKKEMDALRAEGDKAYQERNKLFDERNAISKQIDDLYNKKRESAAEYNKAKDAYYAKVQAIRAARQEKYKAEKAKEDAARREEEIAEMREAAKVPAYTAEIEDCKLLINYLTGKSEDTTTSAEKKTIAGVKELEVRKVESDFAGMRLKKKDEELEGFFGGFGGKGKKKGGRGQKPASANGSGAATPATPSSTDAVNLPLGMLSALLAFGIQPPSSKEDVSRTVSDLETKMAWFEANSEAKTKAEIERVEKQVAKLLKKNADAGADAKDGESAEEKADEKTEEAPAAAEA